MIDVSLLITWYVSLFVIIDPIGLTPMFVALTQGMTSKQRRNIAIRGTIIAALILALFAFFGEALLGFVGISMAAFKIAGGVLLFLTALDMLFERRGKKREERTDETRAEQDNDTDPSVFPLAIPLIAGPGSIATVILLTGQNPGAIGLGAVLGVTVLVLLTAFLFFLTAAPLERLLGKTGINVVTRVLGMLLAALSVQFILEGLRDFGLAP